MDNLEKASKYMVWGLIGALITVVAEMLQGAVPSGDTADKMTALFSSFENLAVWRIGLGSTIGVLGILMQFFGVYGIYLTFTDKESRCARVYHAGMYVFSVIGAIVHVLMSFMAYSYKISMDAMMEVTIWFVVPIVVLFFIGYIPFAIAMAAQFGEGRTPFPKWFWVLNPLCGKAFFGAVTALIPGSAIVNGIPKAVSIRTTIKRINDLASRHYSFNSVLSMSNISELEHLAHLIEKHYGSDHGYVSVCKLGILPHYSSLPNGIRISVEHAFRHKAICFVVCTSTLAQGVNIPIKYLLMTSFMVSNKSMQIRSFQNLMGRTARSGMYTEGSVLVTDPTIYDNKDTYKQGGVYRWRDHVKMFDPPNSEPCKSSILMTVQKLSFGYDNSISFQGARVVNYLLDHYEETDALSVLQQRLTKALPKGTPSTVSSEIISSLMQLETVIRTIENHLCYVFAENPEENKNELARQLCIKTLAYALANETERNDLLSIWDKLATKVSVLNTDQLANYSKAMTGVELGNAITTWISENQITDILYTEEQLTDLIIHFFIETHKSEKKSDDFATICKEWLSGKSFFDISNTTGRGISDLETVCSKQISYELSYLVGNIMDILEISEDTLVNPYPILNKIQRKLKYGVDSESAVSICEKIFNDRIIAVEIVQLIGSKDVGVDAIIPVMQFHKDAILELLQPYPRYFTERIHRICPD